MNYILQHLQEFTVKILGRDKKSILGTGFVVKSNGEVVRILTVAHVVEDILQKHPRQAIGDSIFVSFPLVPAQEERIQEAKILACFVNYDDDLVMLELARGDPRPIAYQNAAQLGTAKDSLNDRFISYGYPHGQSYPEGVTDGLILEIQNAVGSGHYKAQWAKIKTEKYSMRIMGGMSGAPVLDKRRNLVVGIVVGFWKKKKIPHEMDDENFAAGIDCKVLKFDPFNLPINSRVLGLEAGPQSIPDLDSNKLIFRTEAGTMLLGAPDALPHWVGRESILKLLGPQLEETSRQCDRIDWVRRRRKKQPRTPLARASFVGLSRVSIQWCALVEFLQ